MHEVNTPDHIRGRAVSGKTIARLDTIKGFQERVLSHSSTPSVYASNVGRKGVRVYGQTGQKDDGSEYHA